MILAIDLGSTSFKAGVFDRKLQQVSAGRAPLRYRFAAGGRVELTVPVVAAALRQAVRQALAAAPSIRAIAITSQAQTFTVINRHGRPTRPFVTWQDTRAGAVCAPLRKRLPNFGAHGSFADLWPVLQINQLKHAPLAAGETVLTLPSWVARSWAGENVTDDNLAAMSGLYSLALGGWWPAALRACELSESQLPRVVPVGTIAARTTPAVARFGLPVGVPLILAGNDQTAGAYAARLEENGGWLLTLGTAQVAYQCTPKLSRPVAGLIRGPYPGGWSYRMAASGGGNVVNWAQTVLAGCAGDEQFFACAARAPRGCHGLVFDAAADEGRGAWRNLGLHHTSADLARSVLESLSARLAALTRQVGGKSSGHRILVAGGGSRQPLWLKILSEALGAPLAATDASPLLGAARMARAWRSPASCPWRSSRPKPAA